MGTTVLQESVEMFLRAAKKEIARDTTERREKERERGKQVLLRGKKRAEARGRSLSSDWLSVRINKLSS